MKIANNEYTTQKERGSRLFKGSTKKRKPAKMGKVSHQKITGRIRTELIYFDCVCSLSIECKISTLHRLVYVKPQSVESRQSKKKLFNIDETSYRAEYNQDINYGRD